MTYDELQGALARATKRVKECQDAVDGLDPREDQIRDYFTYDLIVAQQELENLRHQFTTG